MSNSLYGHPDAGTFWEQKCDAHAQAVGFKPIGPEWPSCYFHDKLGLLLVVYVDDFKLSGPQKHIKQGWRLLRQGLDIDPGGRQERSTLRLPSGQLASAMTYNME